MTRVVILLSCAVLLGASGLAQLPFEEEGSKRFRFAQTTIGGDLRYTPSSGSSSYLDGSGALQAYELGNSAWGRFIISGWHFWGHVDLYLGLPLLKLTETTFGEDGNTFYNNGIETGLKLYPSKIKDRKLRPFIGFSFNNTVFWQEDEGEQNQNLARNTLPLQAGLTFVKGKNIFDLGLTYNHQTTASYYVSTAQQETISLPRYNLSLGWRTYTDLSLKDEPGLLSGELDELGERIASEKKASGISIAAGLSSPFYLGNRFNSENYPYLGDLSFSNSFIDYGLGYFLAKPDVHFNVAYRAYKSKLNVFGTDQEYRRRSLGIEAYKFLFDYQGFVPFIGPIVSYDKNSMRVEEGDVLDYDDVDERLRYGLVFGWDIRQDKIQWLILRTNLRWYPNYNLSWAQSEHKFDQLEFNIIQAVFYPTRFSWVKKNKPAVW